MRASKTRARMLTSDRLFCQLDDPEDLSSGYTVYRLRAGATQAVSIASAPSAAKAWARAAERLADDAGRGRVPAPKGQEGGER